MMAVSSDRLRLQDIVATPTVIIIFILDHQLADAETNILTTAENVDKRGWILQYYIGGVH